jgi:hypothetical protein
VDINILEEHTATIFRAEVRSVRKQMVYMGLRKEPGLGIGQPELRDEMGRWKD